MSNTDGSLVETVDKGIDARGEELGIRETRARGWFTKLVGYYLQRYQAKHGAVAAPLVANGKHASEAAHSAILWACVKSAVTGASAGMVSTAATLVTAETEGAAALVAVPVAALAIGGEMMYRSFVHLDLTMDLARIFGVHFDANNPDDLWRLYSLVFKTNASDDEESSDPGKALVSEVTNLEGEGVGEEIGNKVLGESVARNIVPFVGIVSSAVTNFIVTRRLGDTVRRYMRYRRAMNDALAAAKQHCREHLDLLIEGMWFIFTADGRLTPEETATLAHMLDDLDPVSRAAVQARFVDDELEWADRIEAVPEDKRDAFLHALEVAAAVDKEVGLPERKILNRAAHHLNREFDIKHLERMMDEFERFGVLTDKSRHRIKGSSKSS
jgi:hypothetical protein